MRPDKSIIKIAIRMKKKFKQFLSEKVKDMGLTDKAIDELVEAGSAGLADNASDDDIKARVDSVVPFAKAMQAEYTRKVQEAKQSQQQQSRKEGEGSEGNESGARDIQSLVEAAMKPHMERIAALENENKALKAAETKKAREAQISAKAKELGIPDFLMKHISIADDADFVKELTEYKQELVNNKLMPAESAGEQGSVTQAMTDAAKAWAQSLPNK